MRFTLSILFLFLSCRLEVSTKYLRTSFPDSFVGKVRLLEEKCCPSDCGVFAWAIAQKFVVLEADSQALTGRQIILVERCPEFKGEGFFRKGKVYKVIANRRYDSTYLIANNYDKKNPLLYWSDETTLAK